MDERERLAREWFDRGDNDFRSAQYLLTMPNPPEDSDLLTPYAVGFRYPDTPAELSREECEQALRIADAIRQAVLEELGWFEKR